MKRYHWAKITAFGSAATTGLAAVIAACVGDGVDTTICGTKLCVSTWVCTEAGDDCYPKGCGDGILDRRNGERCDDGNDIDGDGCSGYCLVLDKCGDGVVDVGETCDDGNKVLGDGCNNDCLPDACLNSSIDLGEECDEGIETETCNDDCKLPRCGDGNPNPFFINPLTGLREVCDDGMNTKFCDADCSVPDCGDGLLNVAADEQCDDGNADNNDGCVEECMPARCGDGYLWRGVEECGEEPGSISGDTADCDADCTYRKCGDGYLSQALDRDNERLETCDDGNSSTMDACPSGPGGTCKLAICGDKLIYAGVEHCDDGNKVNDDKCDSDCTEPVCGDGLHNSAAGEECDDGNRLNIDGCLDGLNGHCKLATCGDGFVHLGEEQCDDSDGNGNPINTMHCDQDCTVAECGDGYVNSAREEECEVNVPCSGGRRCGQPGEMNECRCSA